MAVIMNNSSKQTWDFGKEYQKRHILRYFLYLKNGNLSCNEHFYEVASHHLADFETMIAFLITLLMVAA